MIAPAVDKKYFSTFHSITATLQKYYSLRENFFYKSIHKTARFKLVL